MLWIRRRKSVQCLRQLLSGGKWQALNRKGDQVLKTRPPLFVPNERFGRERRTLVRRPESCQASRKPAVRLTSMAAPKKTVYRDAGNGQFLDKPTFDRRPPNTVEKER